MRKLLYILLSLRGVKRRSNHYNKWRLAHHVCLLLASLNCKKHLPRLLQRLAMTTFLFLVSCVCTAQNTDSLWAVYKSKTQTDTNHIKTIDKLANAYWSTSPDTAIALAEEQLKFAEAIHTNTGKMWAGRAYSTIGLACMAKGNYAKAYRYYLNVLKIREELGDKKGIGNCYNNIGYLYNLQQDKYKAIEYYLKAFKIRKEIGDKGGIYFCAQNIGNLFVDIANYPKALEYYLITLQVSEELDDKQGIAAGYGSLGIVYKLQNNYTKALDYHNKALKLNEELGDKAEIAACNNNIANIYKDENRYSEALGYYLKAFNLYRELSDKQGMATSYGNIGGIYQRQKNYTKAEDYFAKALSIAEELKDKELTASFYVSMGGFYNDLTKYKPAIQYSDSAIKLSKEIDAIENERLAYEYLSFAYSKTGEYKKAYENHVLFKMLTDSIFNSANVKKVNDIEKNFEEEKRAVEQSKIDAIALEEKKRQQVITLSVIGILVLVFIFSIFMYRRYRITLRQKVIIEKQKDIVVQQKQLVDKAYEELEIKNKEVMDSIRYAKRIQTALITSEKYITNSLKRLRKD